MDFRTWLQITEALGPVNRWYCCERIQIAFLSPDKLMEHYIRFGGARDFAFRFSGAMSELNRWYCSEFHHRDVRDQRMLFKYFMEHFRDGEQN